MKKTFLLVHGPRGGGERFSKPVFYDASGKVNLSEQRKRG